MTIRAAIIYLICMWILYHVIINEDGVSWERPLWYHASRTCQWVAYRIGRLGILAEYRYNTIVENGWTS